MALPKLIEKTIVPPIKCQGIKTQLVPFILQSIKWDGQGRWIEPFCGSGVVAFNLKPQKALINDINPHIIRFYKAIYEGQITPLDVKNHLAIEGKKLEQGGYTGKESYYYVVRRRFNQEGSPLDFLFLSRAAFNGVMRFNSKGEFNVPFCQKPDRFRPAYVTKIANQVAKVAQVMHGKDWLFTSTDWHECVKLAELGDFIYVDPPYVGRHTDYFSAWDEEKAILLAKAMRSLPPRVGFALSMWKENKYRFNEHIPLHWQGNILLTFTHFYHVGASEALRNKMDEALIIKPGYQAAEMMATSRQLPMLF